MTDKEIEQAARACVANKCMIECPVDDPVKNNCIDMFAGYIARNANKIPMVRDLPEYEDKISGTAALKVIEKALSEAFGDIDVTNIRATDGDFKLMFAHDDNAYTVTFERGE